MVICPVVDKRMIPWNKGETKFSHPSVLGISRTMAAKSVSNFANWQKLRKKSLNYRIKKSKNSAELIGIILGDGCIERYPRTERLWVTCNVNSNKYIQHIVNIIEGIFHKRPSLRKKKVNMGKGLISIYIDVN